MSENSKKSIFAKLWERRVPQFIATYVTICWGILQFIIFCTNRYDLPDTYVDKFLIFAAVLVPAVAIFTYNHGKPGKDPWKKYEKIIIPINFLIALVFAGLFQGGNEIQAAPQEVTVMTDLGDTITRIVPSIDQTKSFAIFPFKNANADKQQEKWLKFGLPHLLKLDMEQDIRFFCISPFSFDYSIESNNHTVNDDNIPYATFIKIAKDRIVDYFVTGEFTNQGESVDCKIKIYETKSGEEFYTKEFTGSTIFEVVDQVNKELNENLYLDTDTQLSTTDLPSSNLITENFQALKNYINSNVALDQKSDFKSVMSGMIEANKLDPQSAMIQSDLAMGYEINGNRAMAVQAISKALNLSEILPERQKFTIRQRYYSYTNQGDKLIPLLDSWRKLYPRDYYPYDALIGFHKMTMFNHKAKEVGIAALENGHGARVLKRLASICMELREFDEAEQYINEYYELFPNKNKLEDTQLADIMMKKGLFDEAEKRYESIGLINPTDHNISVKLAKVNSKKGEFKKAEKYFDTALMQSSLRADSLNILREKMMLNLKLGQVNDFIINVKKHFELSSNGGDVISPIFQHIQLGGVYTNLGQEQMLIDRQAIIDQYVPQHSETYSCITKFLIGMSKDDEKMFEEGLAGNCRNIVTMSVPYFDLLIKSLEAKYAGDYPESIRLLETYFDTSGTDRIQFGGMIPDNYRQNKEYDKAVAFCNDAIKLEPYEGTLHFALAQTYKDMGQIGNAKEVVKKLRTKIWHLAEPDFIYYDRLKTLEEELENL